MKNRKIIIICIISVVVIMSVNFLFMMKKNDKTFTTATEKIIFLEPNEAYNKIEQNGYIDSFNEIDLRVRNCNSIDECKEIYKKNILSFTEKEKLILIDLIKKIETKGTNKKIRILKSFYELKWKFARVTNKIDNGLPHTHIDTIYLSDKFFNNPSMEVLIHEKIHIYQKKFPDKTDKLYKIYNYEKIDKIKSDRRRANPDLNNFDYKKNNNIIYCEYTENAKSLTDIKLISSDNINSNPNHNEHPDEYFAYLITNKILNKFNENDNELINYLTN